MKVSLIIDYLTIYDLQFIEQLKYLIISFPLKDFSIFNFQLSTFNFQLDKFINYQLSIINCD